MSEYLNNLLKRDPLGEAEELTGLSYKEDKVTSAVGFFRFMALQEEKEIALRKVGDSYFRMNFAEAFGLFNRVGFDTVLWDDFPPLEGEGFVEAYVILWHPDGILATLETFQNTGLNMSKIYYNVDFSEDVSIWDVTSSGHVAKRLDKKIWVGDHDAREGVLNSVDGLRSKGTFLPVWEERPFLWLVNYAERSVDGYDYKAINADRISRLPQYVQDAIRGKEED